MSVKTARKYLMITRFGIPLTMLYATGFALGDIVYRSTGHLGLFYGPLGDLRKASLSGRPRFTCASCDTWAMLIPLAMWVAVLAMECRHQLRRPRRTRRYVLIIGYCLGTISIAAPLLGLRRSAPPWASEVFLGAMAACGLVLAAGAWPDWGARMRITAPLVCAAGAAMALWAFRMEDRARLGHDRPDASRPKIAWVGPSSRTTRCS
jgi:hypothetical protein